MNEPTPKPQPDTPMEAVMEAHLRTVLQSTAGNISQTARKLKVGRTSIYRWMKKWGIIQGPEST